MIVGGAIAKLLELHHPAEEEAEVWADDDGHDEQFPDCAARCRAASQGGLVCEGHELKLQVCAECGYEHDGDRAVFRPWPCPTRRALDEVTAGWLVIPDALNFDEATIPDDPDTFSCPRCGAVSHNPNDAANGYCGRCRWWTGSLLLGHPDVIVAAEAAGKIEPLNTEHSAVIVLAHGDSCRSCRHLIPRTVQ